MYCITPISTVNDSAIWHKINNKTKPIGALGTLETLAAQLAAVLGHQHIKLMPQAMVFAADHGLARAGVSIAPSEVTQQMVHNFVAGGAAINVFCRQMQIDLEVIDCGMLSPLDDSLGVINQRLGAGTEAINATEAMSLATLEQGFEFANQRVEYHRQQGINLLLLGEMGIGNTSSASALMAALLDIDSDLCVGAGTGIDEQTLIRKRQLVADAVVLHQDKRGDTKAILAALGGFEIVQMTAIMLAAAQANMLVIIDGFIASAAALAAVKLNPHVKDYLIFAHTSHEQGHQLMLANLAAKPLLDLGLRLGEGSGAVLAYPLVEAAANFYNQMASFEDAGVNTVV